MFVMFEDPPTPPPPLQIDGPPSCSALRDVGEPQRRSQPPVVYLSLGAFWFPPGVPSDLRPPAGTRDRTGSWRRHRFWSWDGAHARRDLNDGSEVSRPGRPGGPHALLHSWHPNGEVAVKRRRLGTTIWWAQRGQLDPTDGERRTQSLESLEPINKTFAATSWFMWNRLRWMSNAKWVERISWKSLTEDFALLSAECRLQTAWRAIWSVCH